MQGSPLEGKSSLRFRGEKLSKALLGQFLIMNLEEKAARDALLPGARVNTSPCLGIFWFCRHPVPGL
jgi:hypothetical protein